jgi:hypothetical protein
MFTLSNYERSTILELEYIYGSPDKRSALTRSMLLLTRNYNSDLEPARYFSLLLHSWTVYTMVSLPT